MIRRNSDARLREFERIVEADGSDADVLVFVRELQRADRLANSDLRPSMQTRILDVLARQAASGNRDDVLLYMKALNAFFGRRVERSIHSNPVKSGAAIMLLAGGHDPEAVYRAVSQNDVDDDDIDPMLEGLANKCDAAETVLERTRRRSRGRGGRRVAAGSLSVQRAAVARRVYELARQNEPFTGANIDAEGPWRRRGDAWHRQIDISNGEGWVTTMLIEVAFAPESARRLSTRIIDENTDEEYSDVGNDQT